MRQVAFSKHGSHVLNLLRGVSQIANRVKVTQERAVGLTRCIGSMSNSLHISKMAATPVLPVTLAGLAQGALLSLLALFRNGFYTSSFHSPTKKRGGAHIE